MANVQPPVVYEDYLIGYSWKTEQAPWWCVMAGSAVLLVLLWVLLLTPAILAPGIKTRAEARQPASGELASVATFLEQNPVRAPDGARLGDLVGGDLGSPLSQVYGSRRLKKENSLRGYTYRFAITSFSLDPDHTWWQSLLKFVQPLLLLKGSLIVLALWFPSHIFLYQSVDDRDRNSLSLFRAVAIAASSPIEAFGALALRIAWAAIIVGFVSEVMSIVYWWILTAFPLTGVFFGLLFGMCGLLPYVLLFVQTLFLWQLIWGDHFFGKLSLDGKVFDEDMGAAHQVAANASTAFRAALMTGAIRASFLVGFAAVPAALLSFSSLERLVAAACDARGITYQPALIAVAIALLLIAAITVRRMLPPQFRYLSHALRRAIQLTKHTVRARQPEATTQWNTWQAVRLPNGSSLVSVQTSQSPRESVYLTWDGDDAARFVGERTHRWQNDVTYVPTSQAAISELSRMLGEGDSERIVAVIKVARGMRGAAEPLLPGLELLLSAESPKVRTYACEAIGYIGGAHETHVLAKCLSDPDEEVRFYAVIGLERMCLSVDELRDLLSQVKDDVSPAVAMRVGQILATAESAVCKLQP
jgi:hypothetical protein